MKKLALVLALAPAIALAQANPAAPAPGRAPAASPRPGGGPGAGPGAPDEAARLQRAQKRMRLAATLGLAEALDLDEAGALRVRDVIARYGEKRLPIQRRVRDDVRILRDAATGDQAAAGQVDAALNRLRDARAQRQALDQEMLQQLTQGLSPEKKARAALFLARFRERAQHMVARRGGPGFGHGAGPGMGRGMGPGPRHGMDEGPGRWGGPGAGPPRSMMAPPDASATAMSGGAGEPELEEWFADD